MNTNRALNFDLNQYLINRVLESKGIVIYTSQVSTVENDRLAVLEFRRNSKQFILRIHVQHKTDTQLSIEKPDKERIEQENSSVNHHAIFENQLRLPPPLSSAHLDFIEWFSLEILSLIFF